MAIPFTQYLLPDGRTRTVEVDRPTPVELAAEKIIAAGWKFESEILTTGEVSLTVHDPVNEVDVAGEIVPNGPGIGEAVDRLVDAALHYL